MLMAAALLLMPTSNLAATDAAREPDPVTSCREDLGDARQVLLKETAARRLRRSPMPQHFPMFHRSQLSGCARLRFLIDDHGRAQEIVIERFHPHAPLARRANGLLESMEFEPAVGGADEALIMIELKQQEPDAGPARPDGD